MAFDPVVAEILREQGSMSARLDAVEQCIMKMKEEDMKEDSEESEDEDSGMSEDMINEIWVPQGGDSYGM